MKKYFGVLGWFSPNGTGINPIPIRAVSEMHNDRGTVYEFSGFLFMLSDGANFIGESKDKFGVASVSGIFHDGRLALKKVYIDRPGEEIFYDLSLFSCDPLKENDPVLYVGHYRGDHVDAGQCRLVLADISPEFFESERVEVVPAS